MKLLLIGGLFFSLCASTLVYAGAMAEPKTATHQKVCSSKLDECLKHGKNMTEKSKMINDDTCIEVYQDCHVRECETDPECRSKK